MDSDNQTRTYHSPLRAEQQDQTRARILEAAAELMGDPLQAELTYGTIARQAKVSERTVYRHFPTKEELLEAFWEYVNAQLGMAHYPETTDELLAVMPSVYRGFDARAGLIRSHLASAAGRELRQRIAPRRRELFLKMLEKYTADLSPKRQRQVCGVIQLLFSPRAWDSLEENWSMGGREASDACEWAIRTLLEALSSESGSSSDSTKAARPGRAKPSKP